jgi:hypothetical protein
MADVLLATINKKKKNLKVSCQLFKHFKCRHSVGSVRKLG